MSDRTDGARPEKDNRAGKAFDQWLDSLPESTRRLGRGGHDPFDDWLDGLSPEARARAEASRLPDAPTEVADPVTTPRYGLVVCPSGEFPVVKLFKTAEQLATFVGKLEGEDVCVVCFHGHFLPLTEGPPRFILAGDKAVGVPCVGRPEPVVMPLGKLMDEGLDTQDDGFLGPPELAQTYELARPRGDKDQADG